MVWICLWWQHSLFGIWCPFSVDMLQSIWKLSPFANGVMTFSQFANGLTFQAVCKRPSPFETRLDAKDHFRLCIDLTSISLVRTMYRPYMRSKSLEAAGRSDPAPHSSPSECSANWATQAMISSVKKHFILLHFVFHAQFINEWTLTIVRYLADMASVKACQLKPIPGNPSILFQWKHTRAVLVSSTSLKMLNWVRTARRNLGLNTCVDVTLPIYPFNVTVYVSGQFRRCNFVSTPSNYK